MANEKVSDALQKVGEALEKILHIHKTPEYRWEDLDTKLGMVRLFIFWFLILAPITPIGKEVFYWGSAGAQMLVLLLPIPMAALLFGNLHPEADYGEFYDEEGYDNVKEEKA